MDENTITTPKRKLWERAKFVIPITSIICVVLLTILSLVILINFPGIQIKDIITMSLTAIMTLGGVGSGAVGLHDAARDYNK